MSGKDDTLIALFRGLDTPGLSDALDKFGIAGQCRDIAPLDPACPLVVGPAFTVRIAPVSTPPAATLGDYLDEVAPGEIVVIDNGGRTDCSVWGDIITRYAAARKFGGTVIDGACRDIGKTASSGYPMFSRGRFMRTGKGRYEVESMKVPVIIGGVRVSPGDIVAADANGVVAIPRAMAHQVAERAREIGRVEAEMCAQIDAGRTMKEIWAHLASMKS